MNMIRKNKTCCSVYSEGNVIKGSKKRVILIHIIASTQLALLSADDAGKVSGVIRLGVLYQSNEASNDTYGTALGGQLKYETATWNDLKIGIAGYLSQKLNFGTGSLDDGKTNPDFFDPDGKSFAYIGESYIDYSANDITLRIGRQPIDTPLVNTNDIRMLPIAYEAAMATYGGIEKTTLTAGFMQRWTGFDSSRRPNDSLSKFKKFGDRHESSGAYMLGITNEKITDLLLQGWFYSIDKVTDMSYADAIYKITFCDSKEVELSGQIVNFSEKTDATGATTNIDGNLYGIRANFEWGMVTLNAAYDAASNNDGKSVGIGVGGGPYYTSMEEWALDGLEDVKVYRGSVEINMADAGAEGLILSTAYGVFKSAPTHVQVDEWDLVATYTYNNGLSADMSYAMINDKYDNTDGGSDGGYDRFLARLNYHF